jgi:hypothetical protein
MDMDTQGSKLIRSNIIKIPCFLIFLVLALAGLGAASGNAANLNFIRNLLPPSMGFYIGASLLFLGGFLGIMLVIKGAPVRYCFYLIFTVVAVVGLLTVIVIYPSMDVSKSPKMFCNKIQNVIGPNARLVASFNPYVFNYYLHRYPIPLVDSIEKIEEIMSSPENVYLLVYDKHYYSIPEKYNQMMRLLHSHKKGRWTVYLMEKITGSGQQQ